MKVVVDDFLLKSDNFIPILMKLHLTETTDWYWEQAWFNSEVSV